MWLSVSRDDEAGPAAGRGAGRRELAELSPWRSTWWRWGGLWIWELEEGSERTLT